MQFVYKCLHLERSHTTIDVPEHREICMFRLKPIELATSCHVRGSYDGVKPKDNG